jgi:hypothetical protein
MKLSDKRLYLGEVEFRRPPSPARIRNFDPPGQPSD